MNHRASYAGIRTFRPPAGRLRRRTSVRGWCFHWAGINPCYSARTKARKSVFFFPQGVGVLPCRSFRIGVPNACHPTRCVNHTRASLTCFRVFYCCAPIAAKAARDAFTRGRSRARDMFNNPESGCPISGGIIARCGNGHDNRCKPTSRLRRDMGHPALARFECCWTA